MLIFFEKNESRTHDDILEHIQNKLKEHTETLIFYQFIKDITLLVESKPTNNKDIQTFFQKKYPECKFSDPDNLSHYLYASFNNSEYVSDIAFSTKGVYLRTEIHLSSMKFDNINIIKETDKNLVYLKNNSYLGIKTKFSQLYHSFIEWIEKDEAFLEYLKISHDVHSIKAFLDNENNEIYRRKV